MLKSTANGTRKRVRAFSHLSTRVFLFFFPLFLIFPSRLQLSLEEGLSLVSIITARLDFSVTSHSLEALRKGFAENLENSL